MNPYILIIVGAMGLIGSVILLLLGLNMMRSERATKPAAAVEPASVPAATTASTANPLTGLASRLMGARTGGSAHEVLRVLRDNLTGRVLIEVAGTRYSSPGDIPNEAVRAALLTTLHDLDVFAGPPAPGIAQQTTASLPTATARQSSPASDQPAAPRLVPETGRPVPTADAPTGVVSANRPLPPPTMNPFKQMAVLREMAKNPVPEPKSIAEQIDEVLQVRMGGTPLVQRAIHMRPGPRGDAVFEVDGQNYTAVDEVPDETVRDVIRAAIREWEQTQ